MHTRSKHFVVVGTVKATGTDPVTGMPYPPGATWAFLNYWGGGRFSAASTGVPHSTELKCPS